MYTSILVELHLACCKRSGGLAGEGRRVAWLPAGADPFAEK